MRARPRPGRAAPARPARPRSRRPRDRRSPELRPSNGRKPSPRKPAGSASPTTDTASATAGSPSPPPSGAMLKQAVLGLRRPETPPPLRHPPRARARVLRVRHPLPHRPAPPGRRVDATVVVTMTLENPARRQPHPGAVGHRRPDHPPPSQEARPVRPGSSRWSSAGSPRSSTSAAASACTTPTADRDPTRDQHCTHRRMRMARRDVPRSTTTPLGKRRQDNIKDGRLLCPRHHSYAHSPKYEMKTVKNGRVVFSRREPTVRESHRPLTNGPMSQIALVISVSPRCTWSAARRALACLQCDVRRARSGRPRLPELSHPGP
jgi:hypothetical protein